VRRERGRGEREEDPSAGEDEVEEREREDEEGKEEGSPLSQDASRCEGGENSQEEGGDGGGVDGRDHRLSDRVASPLRPAREEEEGQRMREGGEDVEEARRRRLHPPFQTILTTIGEGPLRPVPLLLRVVFPFLAQLVLVVPSVQDEEDDLYEGEEEEEGERGSGRRRGGRDERGCLALGERKGEEAPSSKEKDGEEEDESSGRFPSGEGADERDVEDEGEEVVHPSLRGGMEEEKGVEGERRKRRKRGKDTDGEVEKKEGEERRQRRTGPPLRPTREQEGGEKEGRVKGEGEGEGGRPPRECEEEEEEGDPGVDELVEGDGGGRIRPLRGDPLAREDDAKGEEEEGGGNSPTGSDHQRVDRFLICFVPSFVGDRERKEETTNSTRERQNEKNTSSSVARSRHSKKNSTTPSQTKETREGRKEGRKEGQTT